MYVVCVGTGFATTFFLKRFLEKSKDKIRVLVLERGENKTHQWYVVNHGKYRTNKYSGVFLNESSTDDYYKHNCNTLPCKIKLSIILMLESTSILHDLLKENRKIFLEKLKNKFLLSTDFFQEGMNEKRTIKYVLYYDPYINPCYNPKP